MDNTGKHGNGKKLASLISRKSFLRQSTLSLLGLGVIPKFGLISQQRLPKSDKGKNNHDYIRSIEYNVFNGCIGYKGINGRKLPDEKKYDLVRAARDMGQVPKRIAMQLALYEPDIINFSEAPDEATVAEIAHWLGMNYAYFPSSKYKGNYPGCILTRYEIISSKNRPFVNEADNDPKKLFTRHWGKATLRLPNGELLIVHSAHLWPFTANGNWKVRLEEVKYLIQSVLYDMKHNTKSLLLQGDLNSLPSSKVHKKLTSAGLIDTFETVDIGKGFTATSKNPHHRIDYIYAMGLIAKGIIKSRPLYEGAFRLNNADPKGFALSDHIPVLTDFKKLPFK